MDDFPVCSWHPAFNDDLQPLQIGLIGPRRYVRFPSAPPKRLQQYLSASPRCLYGWSTSFKCSKCPSQDSILLERAIPQNGIAVLETRIYPAFTICNIVGKCSYQLIVNRTLWQHGPVTKSYLVAQVRNAFPCFSGSYPHSSTLSPCGEPSPNAHEYRVPTGEFTDKWHVYFSYTSRSWTTILKLPIQASQFNQAFLHEKCTQKTQKEPFNYSLRVCLIQHMEIS